MLLVPSHLTRISLLIAAIFVVSFGNIARSQPAVSNVRVLLAGDISGLRTSRNVFQPRGGAIGLFDHLATLDPDGEALRLLTGNNLGRAIGYATIFL